MGWMVYAFGGSPAPLTGTRDPLEDALPARQLNGPVVKTESPKEPVQDDVLATQGAEIFATACIGCHGKNLDGTASGPDIRKVFIRHPDVEYYVKFIKDPKSVKPSTMMPGFDDIPEPKLRALAEYLRFPQKLK